MRIHSLRRCLTCLAASIAALWTSAPGRASCTTGDVDYSTSGSGSVSSFTCTEISANTFEVVLVVESTGVYNVTIETFSEAIINHVLVENTGASNTRAVVSVIAGELDGLAQVVSFAKDLDSTGEVWIGTIWPAGNIGPIVLHTNTKIEADRIGTLRTDEGCLTAEVIAHGSAISGQVVAIDTTQVGDIFHDITAENDQIGTITVSGDIGDPTFDDPMNPGKWVVIKGKRDIGSITASAIYADITSVWDDGSERYNE